MPLRVGRARDDLRETSFTPRRLSSLQTASVDKMMMMMMMVIFERSFAAVLLCSAQSNYIEMYKHI